MSDFYGELLLKANDDGETFTLISALTYASDLLGRRVIVPAGFRTDFASVPRGFWNLFPKHGKHTKAAVVHDYLYATNGVTRDQADRVFKEAMKVSGVGSFTRQAMYLAVRLGGRGIWQRYRKGSDEAVAKDAG